MTVSQYTGICMAYNLKIQTAHENILLKLIIFSFYKKNKFLRNKQFKYTVSSCLFKIF